MTENITMALGEVMGNQQVGPGHFVMELWLPLSFAEPAPGQFVMIRSAGHREPFLARPLSVYGFSRREDRSVLELLYRVAGEGTKLLAGLKAHDAVEVLGPLGRGFALTAGLKRAVLIAGGVGVAPLAYLLNRGFGGDRCWIGVERIFYVGAKSAELIVGLEKIAEGCELRICTDDGGAGTRGLVTECLGGELDRFDPRETTLFACGPGPMVRALGRLLAKTSFACQVSLEERMACGLGACLGCAVAIRDGKGGEAYQRVCKDGPVFNLREIVVAAQPGK